MGRQYSDPNSAAAPESPAPDASGRCSYPSTADAKDSSVKLSHTFSPSRRSLIAGGAALEQAVDDILEATSGRAHIFNLGHGILPETPIAHVEQLLKRIRQRPVA